VNKPYSVLLITPSLPSSAVEIYGSELMNAYGLWRELKRLSYITTEYHSSDQPIDLGMWDYAIIHATYGRTIYQHLSALRTHIRHKIVVIMETLHPSPEIDYRFSFLPFKDSPLPHEYIAMPILRDQLEQTLPDSRLCGSILLDHAHSACTGSAALWRELYGWLAPLAASRLIGCLRSDWDCGESIPDWACSIPWVNYPKYLRLTAQYQTFIMTHRGTYEHSIVDMAARGMRVLVPIQDGIPYCDPSLIDELQLDTFTTREGLIELLKTDLSNLPQLDKCTDYSEVVCRIDAYCQKSLTEAVA
jgi:hypothetical protein